jgi:hypothetical protein
MQREIHRLNAMVQADRNTAFQAVSSDGHPCPCVLVKLEAGQTNQARMPELRLQNARHFRMIDCNG